MDKNNMLNNQEMNSLAEKKEKVDFVSFSEVDENGNFREAYGYFEKKYPDTTGEKRQFVAPGGESNFSKMKVDKYLPIGTVVLLKDAKKRVMITGFAVKGKETGDKMYDYMGCMYPEGVISSDKNLMFDHEQIDKVFYMGFIDEEWKGVETKLKKLVNGVSN